MSKRSENRKMERDFQKFKKSSNFAKLEKELKDETKAEMSKGLSEEVINSKMHQMLMEAIDKAEVYLNNKDGKLHLRYSEDG